LTDSYKQFSLYAYYYQTGIIVVIGIY